LIIAFFLEPATVPVAILATVLLYLGYLGIGLQSSELGAPWKVDEGQRITEGYAWRLIAAGDFTSPDWFRAATIRSHPPVAKYVFGASVALAGLAPPRNLDLAQAYDRGAGASTMPEAFATEYLPMRRPARIASFVLNLLTAVMVFAVLLRLQGLGVAALSQILLFRHYLFVEALFYARSDTIQTCLTLLTVVPLLMCVAPASRPARALAPAFVAGALAALAFQTRLNGGVALVMGVAFLAAYAPMKRRTILLVVTAVVAFVLVAVAVNPYYWANPRPAAGVPSDYSVLQSLPVRVVHRFVLQGKDLVALSEGVPPEWHIRSPAKRVLFTASVLGSGKAGALTMAGLLLAIVLAMKRSSQPAHRALVAWGLAGLLVMAVWIPLRWDIYLLIVVPPAILVASLGFGMTVRRLFPRVS
jgi:hypothetical protein